ncbi:MAG: TlpA disulfide reductase family protein [Candidatus Anammoxibacter sp.]
MIKYFLDSKTVFITLMISFLLTFYSVFANDINKPNSDSEVFSGNTIPKITALELKKKIGRNRGKVIIVDFWATWCPPCKEEIPGFINLYKKYKDKGVEIFGVALDFDGNKKVKPYAKKMGINYPLFIGSFDMNEEYDVSGIPTTLIFDKKGNLKVRHVGFASQKEFENEILELLK